MYDTTKTTSTIDSNLLPSVTTKQVLSAIEEQHSSFTLDSNSNLSSAQLELLSWHYRLGHVNMHSLQRILHHSKPTDNKDTSEELCHPCIVNTKFASTKTCPVPKCPACILGKMERIPKSTTRTHKSSTGILGQNAVNPGDRVSSDQYEVRLKGRTLTTSKDQNQMYNGGTIFIDHASGKVFGYHQVSLRAGETLISKRKLEREASQHGITIKSFLSDNGIYKSEEFRSDLTRKNQDIRFSGVGAHHQNGVSERHIKTISYLTRAILIHSALCWPQENDLELWAFAFSHAIYIWNNLPSSQDGLSPEEKWTGCKFQNYNHIRRLHPWGCPAYVLDPKLQDGKKLPKWSPRSRQGKFLGYSTEHATNVGLILNLKTKRISPQFHVLFDDFFQTVQGVDEHQEVDLQSFDWDSLVLRFGTDNSMDPTISKSMIPTLSNEWLTEEEVRQKRENFKLHGKPAPRELPPIDGSSHLPFQQPNDNNNAEEIIDLTNENEDIACTDEKNVENITNIDENASTSHQQNRQTKLPASDLQREPASDLQREPALDLQREPTSDLQREPQSDLQKEPTPDLQREPQSQQEERNNTNARGSRRVRKLNKKYYNKDFEVYKAESILDSINTKHFPHFYTCLQAEHQLKKKHTQLDRHLEYLQTLEWEDSLTALAESSSSFSSQQFFTAIESMEDPVTGTLDEGHPLALAAKVADADNPRWYEATNGENSEGFWDAMWVEVVTLLKMKAWEQVKRVEGMNVVRTTWAYKIKRFPSGLLRKLKARFCVRGDTQKEGIDYFESFAPVVSWSTVRLLLILMVVNNLCSAQVDYLAAFCQAPIDTNVFIDLPKGWERLNKMGLPVKFKPGHVLKLKRSLYGLVQSPKNFFKHLKGNLEKSGFKQSQHDPCLFISEKVICLVYVDDCLFFSKHQHDIDTAIEKIKDTGMDLEKEDDAAGFLGVDIQRDDKAGTVNLTQKGLIKKVIQALGVEDANPKLTPAPKDSLGRDLTGAPFCEDFNYASVVGMMMYLCNNTRPDIAFAVNQCARYTHHPTEKHANYLRQVGKYLKGTDDKGLVLNPSKNGDISITSYVDADFAGLWNKDEEHDPHCVRSRAGWIIMIAGCPIIWRSKLMTEICLSTMESEYIALSTSCRDLLPLHNVVEEVGQSLGLNKGNIMNIKSTIWEDNEAALKLANLELPYMTKRSKHIAIKYHWFRSFVGKKWTVNSISSVNQLADIFTKGLSQPQFETLRKRIMGW